MCNREMSSLATCPYCDELVGAEAVQYGVERMHPECFVALGQEMDRKKMLIRPLPERPVVVSSKEIAGT